MNDDDIYVDDDDIIYYDPEDIARLGFEKYINNKGLKAGYSDSLKEENEKLEKTLKLIRSKYNTCRIFLQKMGYILPLEGQTAEKIADFIVENNLDSMDKDKVTDFDKFLIDVEFIDE